MNTPCAEPTAKILSVYRTMVDCAADLSGDYAPVIVAKAALNVAARCLWDVLGEDGAQIALRKLADELPRIIGEEGRALEVASPVSVAAFGEAGTEAAP